MKLLKFSKSLHFEIVNYSAILIYGKGKYFLVDGISADLMKIIILMDSVYYEEIVFYAKEKFKKQKNLDKKIADLIDKLEANKIIQVKTS